MYKVNYDVDTCEDLADSEPADPSNETADHEARRNTRLWPGTDPSIPKFFIECGCGNCPDHCDPLCEKDIEGVSDFYAAEVCPSPRSMTVERACEAYIRYEGASFFGESRTSSPERHRGGQYARILAADRHFRANYDGLTTVIVTRRIDPKDEHGNWLHPKWLDKILNNSSLLSKIASAARYHLQEFEFNYLRVVAPTESAATPHEHRLFFIEDPDNEITVEHFEPVLQKHLDYCINAKEEDHPSDVDGKEGAITIRHKPPLVDLEPEKKQVIAEYSKSLEGVDEFLQNTQIAQYLASQLAHLPACSELSKNRDDVRQTLLEGGAIARATSNDWFSTSNGVPKLGG